MNLRSNVHTHTVFCDGKNTVEEMALAAIDLDFLSLGFSIHGWTPYEFEGLSLAREAEYRAEVRRVREKYRDRIEILLGAEREALYERDFSAYEYLIDSTHYFLRDGEYICVDRSQESMLESVNTHFGGDFYAYCRAYFERVCEMCAHSTAQVIGHLDLVRKFNEGNRWFDENDPRYLTPALEAADAAVESGIAIEMNSGAISRGYRSDPYPSLALLKRIRERGGEIIINSDAHAADALAQSFDLCQALAVQAGFDHVLRLRASGFEEVPLADVD